MSYPLTDGAYELLSEVGTGATAKVYRGRCVPLDQEVAVKIIDLDKTKLEVEQFQREIAIMSKSNHANVVKLRASFSKGSCLWLILDYYPYGSIADVLLHYGGLKCHEELLIAFLYQSLQALQYFHENGQMHRDVKAANLLLGTNGYIAMADFGVSSEAPACRGSVTRQTFVGTPCWMAPEVLTRRGYRKTADIWSLGITALEMAFSKPPLASYPPMKVMAITLRGDPPSVDTYGVPHNLSKEFRAFVTQCLSKNPAMRPSALELLSGPLFAHIRSTDHAAEIARSHLNTIDIKPLAHKPVRIDGGVDDEPRFDWNFPSTVVSADDGAEGWRGDCAITHKQSSNRYEKGAIIETHSRLTTYRAVVKATGEAVAFHEIECDAGSYDEPLFSPTTIETILSVQHEGILQCIEVWENGEDKAYYVTEAKENGTIASHLNHKGPIEVAKVVGHGLVIAEGLALLHSLGIMHRRVMPHSVFFTRNGSVRLGAVMSTLLPLSHKSVSMRQVDPPGGVEAHLAPEQFEDEFSDKVDVYSFGLLLLEMLTARTPYQECKNPMKLILLKTRGTPPDSFMALEAGPCPPRLRDLIASCIATDPTDRPTMGEVVGVLKGLE